MGLTWIDYYTHFNKLKIDTWYSIEDLAKRDPSLYRSQLRDFHDRTGRVTISDDLVNFKLSPPVIADVTKNIFFKT